MAALEGGSDDDMIKCFSFFYERPASNIAGMRVSHEHTGGYYYYESALVASSRYACDNYSYSTTR